MKNIIIIFLVLLLASNVFAMNIDLGKVELNKNQTDRLFGLRNSLNGVVKGFGYYNAEKRLVAVTDRELTEEEKILLVNNVKALSNAELPKIKTLEERVSDLEKKIQ